MHKLLADQRVHQLFDIVVVLLVILLVFEVGIRLVGTTNRDGEFHFLGYRLKPYALPVESAKVSGFEYLATDQAYIEYAPVRGWKISPNRTGSSGLAHSNGQGLRGEKDYSLEPEPGVLRIAAFGDSFVHGDDVYDNATWVHQLEIALAPVIPNETLNFGVPGYSIGQAMLAYERAGKEFNPDIVLIGFQPENCFRNVNIYRGFYVQNTSLPFFKPRHIFDANGQLQLINTPTPDPSQVARILEDFEAFEFAKFGYFYDSADYEQKLTRGVKVFALFELIWEIILRQFSDETERFFDTEEEGGKLCYALLKKFETEAIADGAHAYIVHIPYERYFRQTLAGGKIPYQKLFDQLRQSGSKIIDLQPLMEAESKYTPVEDLYIPHFSAALSLRVARHVANCIAADANALYTHTGVC